MSNLEHLTLDFPCVRKNSFVHGNDLKMNIINHLPRLRNFRFNIYSFIPLDNQINRLTNDEIQCTFKELLKKKIISSVDYFLEENQGQCHVFTYPFISTTYDYITNQFPGGLFQCVRKVSLIDQHPFENQFFLRIQNSFPLMQQLAITNWKPQLYKRSSRDFSIIQYSHLAQLDLLEVHDHYSEQFLLHMNTCLSRNLTLYVNYQSLRRVTHNF